MRATGVSRGAGAQGAPQAEADASCEWATRTAERMQLPELPDLRDFDSSGYQWSLPPIPRLMPVQELLSLAAPRTVLADVAPLVPDAYASPSAPASSLSVSAGAAGTFAALSVAAGLWFASKAIPRRAHIAHTLPVRAAAVASGSAMSK